MLGELVAELLGPGGGEIRYEAPADDDPLLPRAPSSKGRAGAPLRAVGPDGRYELLGRLNGGGQAVLWAARDTENLRLVAVKTTSPHLGAAGKDTDAARRQVDGADARLRRELEILRSLKRVGAPHVMPLLDGGPGRLLGRGDDGAGETARTWLALPLLPHVTLADLLRRHPQGLPEDAAWEYTRDLARALDALHEHDDQQAGLGLVVHRDLSPGNVLATPAGVYVADFGMAWSANLPDADVAHTTGLTGLHGAGATAGWVAPERLRPETGEGPGPVPAERDPAGDVFAWGLHAFSALTGRHPWAAYDPTGGRLGFHHHVSEAMRRGDPIDLAPLDSYDWTAPIRHALTQERTARMEAQKAWKEELLAPGRSPTQRRLEATRERERSLQGHFLKLIDERSELGRQLMEQEAAARSEQQGREAAERAASTQERELRRRDALLREAGFATVDNLVQVALAATNELAVASKSLDAATRRKGTLERQNPNHQKPDLPEKVRVTRSADVDYSAPFTPLLVDEVEVRRLVELARVASQTARKAREDAFVAKLLGVSPLFTAGLLVLSAPFKRPSFRLQEALAIEFLVVILAGVMSLLWIGDSALERRKERKNKRTSVDWQQIEKLEKSLLHVQAERSLGRRE